MCVYCTMGDDFFRHDPPWRPHDYPAWPPQVPAPVNPVPNEPWNLDKLKAYYELLKKVRELEEKVGCPCEPNKADYIALFEKRIEELEKRVGK